MCRGKDLTKLQAIPTSLMVQETLSVHYRDHPLRGNWQGYREAHIEPDWMLLIELNMANCICYVQALILISSRNEL